MSTDNFQPCPIGKDTGNGCTCKVRCKPADPNRTAVEERASIVAHLRAIPADGETESYARWFAQQIEEGRHDA